MPRQINPGKNFKRWVPTDANPDSEEAVFPELAATDYTDEEWENADPESELGLLKIKINILDQALFSCLMAMFDSRWKTPKTKWQKQRAIGAIISPGLEQSGFSDVMTMPLSILRGERLWQEYTVRIINTEPTGHYVGK